MIITKPNVKIKPRANVFAGVVVAVATVPVTGKNVDGAEIILQARNIY